ncbi:S-protein homolog 5-like, partial [Lycium ferocissimum]|uniref:S-protein homolog 5-like n=1 Tax=Lycium ferocissimum TaxID=112874 RepID=UPI002814D1DE
LLITPFDLSLAKKCIFSQKFEVHVINKLPLNSPSLQVHCASKKELGKKYLAIDEDFNWSFCESFLDRAFRYSHFWWESKDKVFNVFDDPYYCVKHGKNVNYLKYCKWEVRPDGFYLEQYNASNSTYYMDRYYEWS